MPGPSLPDVVAGLSAQIGRYFSVVSVVPSIFLTMWTTALITSGSWGSGVPDLPRMVRYIGGLTLGGTVWLFLVTIVFALFLHPLQVTLTRSLEGYWGSSRLARTLLRLRITHHRKRYANLSERKSELEVKRNRFLMNLLREDYFRSFLEGEPAAEDPDSWSDKEQRLRSSERLFSDDAHPVSGIHAAAASIARTLGSYPTTARMMPTRFGNALRTAEDSLGRQYGLKAIRTTPHVALVAPELHLDYLQDTRQQMDTAVRLSITALVATAETVLFLITDGWWLLIALIPYLLAYLSYRASVAAASEYTGMVGTILDLNRFRLYENLRLPLPVSTDDERRTNVKLMRLLDGGEENLSYKHPASPTPPGNP